MRVTAGCRLRLTTGKLERAEYWRLATPAEVAAWDAHTAAQAAADVVALHMARCPSPLWNERRFAEISGRAARAVAWAGRLAELHTQLEAAVAAAAVALEACQPAPPKGEA